MPQSCPASPARVETVYRASGACGADTSTIMSMFSLLSRPRARNIWCILYSSAAVAPCCC